MKHLKILIYKYKYGIYSSLTTFLVLVFFKALLVLYSNLLGMAFLIPLVTGVAACLVYIIVQYLTPMAIQYIDGMSYLLYLYIL